MKKKCIDKEVGGRVGLEIVFSTALRREPRLTPAYRKHLQDCDCCRESVPQWIKKGKATQGAVKSTEPA